MHHHAIGLVNCLLFNITCFEAFGGLNVPLIPHKDLAHFQIGHVNRCVDCTESCLV